ncbi:beta-galactosidase [Paenibacillus thailandensis]|uniref:Beta-galactosidase n=1 Tax=Paenibacillus thailandensis TaxID=393250 RepID=A0ABW5QW57_9BACL
MALYRLNLDAPDKEIVPSTLKLGGTSPSGGRISFTNYYMELDGKPYFGICGEFHYSRYPREEWDAELSKMKLNGINIAATYIFWNHHEETEGRFEWDGRLDLRYFIELCGKHGLFAILRVGPFCHGEVKNGGMPDWLFGRPFEIRSNDERYLAYVRRLYEQIGMQAAGLFYQDGGPVIGIQLENEYMHAAAIWELTAKQGDVYMTPGADGESHMRRLKAIAREAGLIAPIYTSTGWGGAPVLEDEVLPLYGGYAYTPWTVNESNPEQKPTGEYVFADYHNDEGESPGFEPPYSKSKYPFACCEMGGGMQTWYKSRFVVEPQSAAAMAVMKIAGGCNFVGYYMFHGGTNPVGRSGYMNESTTPKITYDFQAPIGEFGQVRESAARLRLIHSFLRAFGERLAPMGTVLPEGAARIQPDDAGTLRYAARVRGGSGFLFVNNYQDHAAMARHRDVRFRIGLGGETLSFPQRTTLTIEDKAYAIMPLNLRISGLRLKYATAMPAAMIEGDDGVPVYLFAMPGGTEAELCFDSNGIAEIESGEGVTAYRGDEDIVALSGERSGAFEVRKRNGERVRFYVMTEAESLTMWEAEWRGRKRVIFSEAPIADTERGLRFILSGEAELRFRMFPGSDAKLIGPGGLSLEAERWRAETAEGGWFDSYLLSIPRREVKPDVEYPAEHKAVVRVPDDAFEGHDEVMLSVEYDGDVGYAFAGGELFHDHFYNGQRWEIGLSRFRDRWPGREIVLHVTPRIAGKLRLSADAGMALQQELIGSKIAAIRSVRATPVYGITLV